MSVPEETSVESHGHADHGPGEHDEQSFVWKYIFSQDHKVIGIQYGLTSLCFLLFGFCLMILMRWQLASPGAPIPWIGNFLGQNNAPGGIMLPEFYNQLGAMHGTIMVFLAVVPMIVGAFGNYVVPLQIGAPDMAFPKLNMASYWVYFIGGVVMLASFFLPGGAANSGWTSYAPLSVIATMGQTAWLIGMTFLITSSLLGSINIITTIFQLRAPGMTWMRLPYFVWSQLVTSFLLLLAFPPLEAAAVLQLMDRLAGTSFFMPSGLYVSGQALEYAGGGSVLLWQHLFWFLAHPEVYVLVLPAFGIISEIIANNTRKPLWGYKALVYSGVFLGFMSFIVWAHHMFMTGMGTVISAFFQTTTMIISIPSVVILTALLISLWGGSIRFNTPMLFALAFLPMFGIGGLTGLPLGLAPADIHLHDTYYVIGHFHYVVAPGVLFGLFAGLYHWYPKITGRHMDTFLGHLHFWPSLIFMNMLFFPMLVQGMAGFHRRWYNGGDAYLSKAEDSVDVFGNTVAEWIYLNPIMSWGAWLLALAQIPFIINFISSIWVGKKIKNDNPYDATTLEWATPTPPPHGNFTFDIAVYRGPYEYSRDDHEGDFFPQWEEPTRDKPAEVPVEEPAR